MMTANQPSYGRLASFAEISSRGGDVIRCVSLQTGALEFRPEITRRNLMGHSVHCSVMVSRV